MSLWSASRDRLVENVAIGMLNRSVIQKYGRVTRLKLDSEQKRIDLTVELRGEREPIELNIGQYEITQQAGRVWVLIQQAGTSREWLTALANDFLVGKRFELPPEVASAAAPYL